MCLGRHKIPFDAKASSKPLKGLDFGEQVVPLLFGEVGGHI
jgi:hypothetical protein